VTRWRASIAEKVFTSQRQGGVIGLTKAAMKRTEYGKRIAKQSQAA
jgi:hypothetical protein